MDTRNKRWAWIGIWGASLLLVSLLSALLTLWFVKSGSNHYAENIDKVVEVKAYDSEDEPSYGTGWFLDSNTLATCYHVLSHLSNGERICFTHFELRFSNSEEYEFLTLENYDAIMDVAFLRYEGKHSHSSFPTRDSCATGDQCFCIGNYSNYGLSYKEGVISLKAVRLDYNDVYADFIQCSISIGQGDSGAPLFDQNDKALGMIAFRSRDLTGTVQQGFAYVIPVGRMSELRKS